MMHIRLIAVLVALIATSAPAQDGRLTLGLGVSLNTPAGELADGWQTGIGGTVLGEYAVDARWTLGGALNVMRFPGKTIRVPGINGSAPDLNAWGISAGARNYLGTGNATYGGLYLASEFGYYQFEFRDAVDDTPRSETEIGVLPTLGYRTGSFDLSAQLKLGGRYQWLQFRGAINLLRM